MKTNIILASASPRRKELLEREGIEFEVRVSQVDETLEGDDALLEPQEAAKKLAERKAGAVVQELLAVPGYVGTTIIIGADTMVVLDGEVFGKPRSVSEATGMLRKLSGRRHEVVTAVSLWAVSAPEPDQVSVGFRSFCEVSGVTFNSLTDEQIKEYLAQGESFDKAGAYAAQGEGRKLIESIDGDIDNVIGLPVSQIVEFLQFEE